MESSHNGLLFLFIIVLFLGAIVAAILELYPIAIVLGVFFVVIILVLGWYD